METTFDSIIENYNQRNEFVAKIWVWIAIISIFGFVTITQKVDKSIEIPGIDFAVPADSFIFVFILILSGLIIRWSEAFHRSYIFRQEVIEPLLEANSITVDKKPVDQRKLIDSLVYTSTTSVWGLVPDFFDGSKPKLKKLTRKVIYLFMKFIVILVHFILPGFITFFIAFFKIGSTKLLIKIPIQVIASIAILAIFLTMAKEIKYIQNTWKKQLSKLKPPIIRQDQKTDQ